MFDFEEYRDQNWVSSKIVTFGKRNTIDPLENQFSMQLIEFLTENLLPKNLPLNHRN